MKGFGAFCKELGANLGGVWLALIPFAFAFVLSAVAINYGWLETNEHHYAHEYVPAMEDLEQSGGNLSDAGGVLVREAIDQTDDFFSIKAAVAHAANVCTHSSGVVSNDTGTSRHLTSFRKHENGRHYTITRHQILQRSGWITIDSYRHSETRGFCGC